jgi:hypothetical protein
MRQLGLLQLTEVHVSICAFLGALFLIDAAIDLLRYDALWPAFALPMLIAAALALGSAFLPWIWPNIALSVRRMMVWPAWLIGTAAAISALLPLNLNALLGSQLILLAGVLSEMTGRPAALRWFWFSLVLTAMIIYIYYVSAPLRPIPD